MPLASHDLVYAQDIINGAFKGFAMLRQTAYMLNDPLAPPFDPPLYVPRYGFVARNQVGTQTLWREFFKRVCPQSAGGCT